jgi:hypothetical protein
VRSERRGTGLLVFILLIALISFASAVEIYISPPSQSVGVGSSFDVFVRGKAPAGGSDVYAIQYNLTYNPSVLTFNAPPVKGSLLSTGGITTVFTYSSASGVVTVYESRNGTTTGVNTADGLFTTLNFTLNSATTSYLNLTNVIWVNSTMTNSSVGLPSVVINNGSVSSAPCSFTNASWSTSSTTEGNSVTLTVQGTGCSGQQVNFTIWEYDTFPGIDDNITTNPGLAVFSGTTATATWITEWQGESFPETNPPEYYFDAFLVSSPSTNIQSSDPKLQVNKLITQDRIYVSPSTRNVVHPATASFDIKVQAPVTASDIYGVQFDILYNSSLLSANIPAEGPILGSDGAVTLFDYTITPGNLSIYNIRNVTNGSGLNPGLYTDDGIVATVSFNTLGLSGSSLIDLANVIWVNSTIDNDTAMTIVPIIDDGSVSVSAAGAVCGNGIVEGTEQCDGTNLSGQTCITLGFTGGTLSCAGSCTFNTASCTGASPTIVSVDSTYTGGYNKDNLIDNIIAVGNDWASCDGTGSCASGPDTAGPHWVALNFSSPQTIGNVTIWWAYNDLSVSNKRYMTSQQVDIQYWNGASYVTIANINPPVRNVSSNSTRFIPVSTTSLRYWQPANMGDLNYTEVMWLTEVQWGSQGLSPPSGLNVVLESPSNGATGLSSNVNFRAGATTTNTELSRFNLFTNTSGTWQLRKTSYPELPNFRANDVYNGINMAGNTLLMHMNNDASYGESPSLIYDFSGNGNNGTVSGATVNSSGKFGGAYSFNGVSQYIDVGDKSNLEGTPQITISAWINPSSVASGYKTIVSKEGVFFFRKTASGAKMESIKFTGLTPAILTSNADLVANKWQHVVMTYNGTALAFYYNGQFDSSLAATGVLDSSTSPVQIGKHSTSTDYYSGSIDEIAIWNRSLTSSEISRIYNVTKDYHPNFDLTGISPGTYRWNVEAIDNSSNSAFAPSNYTFSVAGAGVPPTVNILSPANLSTLTTSNITVIFETINWTVGGKGTNHIHFHVDGSPDHLMFYNAPDNVVEFNTVPGPTPLATWINSTTVQINNLANGVHTIRAHLADISHSVLPNPEASEIITITVSAADITYPQFSSFVENPVSGSAYSTGSKQFDATVTNTNGTVYLSLNGTKYLATSVGGGVYRASVGGLAVSSYNYFWESWGSGSSANYNSSSTRSYLINKATPTGTITSSAGFTFNYGTSTTITRVESNSGDSDVSYILYKNGVNIGTVEGPLILGAGIYNYVLNTTGGQNYSASASIDARTLTVNPQPTTTTVLTSPPSPIIYSTSTISNFSCSNSGNLPTTLYINGTNSDSQKGLNIVRAAGTYTVNCTATGNQNYTGGSQQVTYQINRAGSTTVLQLNGNESDVTVNTGGSVFITGAVDVGDSLATLNLYRQGSLVASQPGFVSSNENFPTVGLYNITLIYVQSQNYTSSSKTNWVNVTAAAPTCTDGDGDGYNQSGVGCGVVDCNDLNISINPGAVEQCSDGVDNDCDGNMDLLDSDCGFDYDVNNDGFVNIADISMAAMQFGATCSGPGWCGGRDINRNGVVNIQDLSLIGLHFT